MNIQNINKLIDLLRDPNSDTDLCLSLIQEEKIDNLSMFYEEKLLNNIEKEEQKGFLTPEPIAKLMGQVGYFENEEAKTLYDPTCGTGNLLFTNIKDKENQILVGQEINPISFNISKCLAKDIASSFKYGDTLLDPYYKDPQGFDLILSNPPFSIRWLKGLEPKKLKELEKDPRFEGVKKLPSLSDYAFIYHCLYHMGNKSVILLPQGVKNRYNERKFREQINQKKLLEAIIKVPSLFINTSIQTEIFVFSRKEKEGFWYIDTKNEDFEEMFNLYKDRKEVEGKCKFVPYSEGDWDVKFSDPKEDKMLSFEEFKELHQKIKKSNIRIIEILKHQEEIIDQFILDWEKNLKEKKEQELKEIQEAAKEITKKLEKRLESKRFENFRWE